MEVAQVVPRIAELASGTSQVVLALCNTLADQRARVVLHTLEPAPAVGRLSFEVRYYPTWRLLAPLGISPALHRGLTEAASRADILHNHSLWMMPNVYPAQAVRSTKCRLVASPHGTLSPWALRRSHWRKRIVWQLGQGRVLRDSACLHATSEEEFQDIRRLGLRAPVAIIPNGVEIPNLAVCRPVENERRRLLFLGRIHPKKGIDTLLRSWRRMQDRAPDWDLWIVGPDNDGYTARMQQLANTLGSQRVFFQGAVHDAKRREIFLQADLFVLPTHSENFGLAVAESLAHGVPAIVSRGAPWAGLETHRCGWWIDLGEEALTRCLLSTLVLPRRELRAMGQRGREWMEREFSWARVGRMMLDTYQWLLGGGSPPDWVRREIGCRENLRGKARRAAPSPC